MTMTKRRDWTHNLGNPWDYRLGDVIQCDSCGRRWKRSCDPEGWALWTPLVRDLIRNPILRLLKRMPSYKDCPETDLQ